ncbi:MAG: tetratricopeptide repeat protein [Desulfobacterium sp.]|nr:tetratricopeptide repeat protein [Desulfobacterium sp.]MBU3947662.1 YcaO-like family protein [Pseudomonadota bacterium]MBU4037570.1 YcaO-like family protein [Pseudomonadota bacterium]
MSYEVILNDAFKRFTLDQDKIKNPEETINSFKSKLKELDLDILESTLRIDNGRLGVPVYFSICGKDALTVTGTKKQMGKGATPAQAEASAVMELAERFSFFSFCNNSDNFFYEKPSNIKGPAIPFEMIAKSVHDSSEDLDITRKIYENLTLKWTWAYNLTRKEKVLIPFNWFYMINEFNGPSAGNCAEEALSQGICEIVERHVSSLISTNNLKVPIINPDSATDPMVVEMIGKYRAAGIKLYISDFSLGLGIPTVGVLAYDPSTFPEKSEIVWTAGTTPDPQKALSRALTEVAQLAGDFNTSSNYVASGLPKFKTIDKARFIIESETIKDIQNLPDISSNNIKVEVENLISSLSANNMEVIVINTMHHKLKIPAFYTIVPGAYFRERASGASTGLFCAKIIIENYESEKALHELKHMDQILPGKYFIKFYIGQAYLLLNDPVSAVPYFKQALDLDPSKQDVPSIYSYIGICYKEMEEYRQAIYALKEGEKRDNERTDIFNLMGFCHFMLKEYEMAIESFKKVISLDPASAIDYANIASNYRDMGEKEKAIYYYKTALELDPSIEFARTNLSKLLKA